MNEQEQLQMLMSQLEDSNLRQSVMQHIQQTAKGLDGDRNSKVLIQTLARESVHNQKNTAMWKSRTKKSVAVGVIAVILAITVQFLVNYFTNEMSKESHVDKDGAMVSTDGKVVQTQMEEMKVDADGKLLSRRGGAAVKTMPSLAKVPLTSSLPDATLMALDEITVHSDKGYTLQIKVLGFSRVPVLNSRCGNIVHFYTAWNGKVTLDSTDLSFDEATAAKFENAGFSLATGRRLADTITVDGFAKALAGIRESGKWTCADVPLPSFDNLGESQVTEYDFCGDKHDKNTLCFSQYGGLKVGVAALEESLATAMATKTSVLKNKKNVDLYVRTSSFVLNSHGYRVRFSKYPQHPGQEFVRIADIKSNKMVNFQMESDKTRSHCNNEFDQAEKTNAAAINDDKVDTDWHFEYMGMSEENGRVLRHFRLGLSSEYVQHMWGENSLYFHYWDVADDLQPARIAFGRQGFMVFETQNQQRTDAEVVEAVRARTGRSVADLLNCSIVEREDTQRPKMHLFADLSTDADYYLASSANKTESLKSYLETMGGSFAMPDLCYSLCQGPIENLKKTSPGRN